MEKEQGLNPGDIVYISRDSGNFRIRDHEGKVMKRIEEGAYTSCYKVCIDDGSISYVPEKDLALEGICRICGCTENDPCFNPKRGFCRWADESRTLCSHCAIKEIAEDPETVHCVNTGKGLLPAEDDDVEDVVTGILLGKAKEGAVISNGAELRGELGLDSLDITETLIECEREYDIKEQGIAVDMVTVHDIIDWVREYRNRN